MKFIGIFMLVDQLDLYFIALIPSPEVCGEINAFKKDFFDRFNSKAALKVTPHITLKTPFKLTQSDHFELLHWFRGLDIRLKPFVIELKDFGAFHKPKSPVVFVRVMQNTSLFVLQNEVMRNFQYIYPQLSMINHEPTFVPHMTIAYRDLSPEQFKIAWKEYATKEFSASFTADRVCLLKHNTKQWNVLETIFLKE